MKKIKNKELVSAEKDGFGGETLYFSDGSYVYLQDRNLYDNKASLNEVIIGTLPYRTSDVFSTIGDTYYRGDTKAMSGDKYSALY